ncbi:5'-Nucleotidase, C-terminal [Pseudocohnilembus persalinus]|uniref:5'-Nucleotidase, C-terminal n=1 Tax=Pseudocohnilembus persalinus TaxID=266149 RepID=A0A0V0R2F9_PSEPJ|nr:5'-Nucleotidase, C-terminal [Pseudocohnilembus persalinus]|eukprot:KRX08718.1 5'-Nucleotidase, C-terminal [Pseudocohnilembus persalinus]
MQDKQQNKLRIVHFNDVYNIEENKEEPVGGISRFVTAVRQIRNQKNQNECLTLFSGDAYSPSAMSSLYDGVQMIEPLNAIGIDAACLGNHELDYDLDEIINLTQQNNFPWIMSNVLNTLTDSNIANTLEYFIMEKNGFKIGIMGIAEEEWLGVITTISPEVIEYEDFIECAKRLSKNLREKHKCDIVIALSHMRNPNDIKLGQNVPDIDFILGGHDHIKHLQQLNDQGTLFLKSGTDFKMFSYFDLEQLDEQQIAENLKSNPEENVFIIKNKWKVTINFVEITKEYEREPEIQKHVEYYVELSKKEQEKIIGYLEEDLDTRFSYLRTHESPFGNFFTDICKIEMGGDIAIINTGTFRSDCIFQQGFMKFEMINKILPILDTIVMIEVSGEKIHQALENSVSKYPGFDGRFPSISGIKFTFDADLPKGQRIKKQDIYINGEVIDYDRNYKTVVKYFLSLGKDGYDMLENCKYIIDEENGTPHMDIVKNFFYSFKREQKNKENYDQAQIRLSQIGIDSLQNIPNDDEEQIQQQMQRFPRRLYKRPSIRLSDNFIQRIENTQNNRLEQVMEMEQEHKQINKFDIYQNQKIIYSFKQHPETQEKVISIKPKIENRIIVLNEKQVKY